MALTDDILTDNDEAADHHDQAAAKRRAWCAGMRELASFVEAHPDLPVPSGTGHLVYLFTKAELVAVARVAGVRWQKDAREGSDYFTIKATFQGGHSYEAYTDRAHVCRREVTGTKVVPAQPEHEVEEFRWICNDEPLLSNGVAR